LHGPGDSAGLLGNGQHPFLEPFTVGVTGEAVGVVLESRWVALGLRLAICPPSVLNCPERTAAYAHQTTHARRHSS
jgi:hypothetical protein